MNKSNKTVLVMCTWKCQALRQSEEQKKAGRMHENQQLNLASCKRFMASVKSRIARQHKKSPCKV